MSGRPFIVFTDHARDRYERRVKDRVPLLTIAAEGELRTQAPGYVSSFAEGADMWLVYRRAAFAIKVDADGTHVAVTCIARPTPSKADRRAWRSVQREEQVYPDA